MNRLIFIIIILVLIDIYFFQSVRVITQQKWVWYLYWGIDIALLLAIIFIRFGMKESSIVGYFIFGLMLVSLGPKLVSVPFLLLEDLSRFGLYAIKKIQTSSVMYPDRRKFVSQFVLLFASVPFFSLIYGMAKGKYDYKIRKIKLAFPSLPSAFDGFTITQLSDIHTGSFNNRDEVARGIAMANEQKSDLMLFTGDLVNNKAAEAESWKDLIASLQAPAGKFSVLGNHDYGDYYAWGTEGEKNKNFQRLIDIHQEMGFKLLRNESVSIEKDGEKITLIGVENWGKGGFHKYGDLERAAESLNDGDFSILMSHDPSHWDAKVRTFKKKIHLTLSGHTHGMQFGIEIGDIKWSPAQYIYKQWAGLYAKAEQYLYVNRGFGFLGYPGRVGIKPEITVITLTRA